MTTTTKRRGTVALALAVACAAACSISHRGEGVEGSGKQTQSTRDVKGFTAVDIGNALSADISLGSGFSVVVTGDDNLVPLVTTKVEGGALQLGTERNRNLRPRGGLKVTVTLPALDKIDAGGASHVLLSDVKGKDLTIEAGGASQIRAQNLVVDKLAIDAGGASQIEVTGSSTSARFEASGASKVLARGFPVRTVEVEASGASTVEVDGKDAVSGEASGASHIAVAGKPPRVTIETSGASSVKHLP